jgi:hypothetical protein
MLLYIKIDFIYKILLSKLPNRLTCLWILNMIRLIKIILFLSLIVPLSCISENLVTFRIAMHQALIKGVMIPSAGDRVEIRGSFNSWESDSLILVDPDLDSIYTGTFNFSNDLSDEEFKYVIVKTAGAILWEMNPDPENPPYGNRKISFSGSHQLLPASNFKINPYDLHYAGISLQFSVNQLQSDFKQLRHLLEDEHCCLYNYTSKTKFDSIFSSQYGKLNHAMSPSEFFRTISPISAQIGCGHSGFWMSGDFWNMGYDKLFPLQIGLIEGKVVVAKNITDTIQVPVGSIIYKINGRSVPDIVTELKNNYAADAFNDHFRLSQVERRFSMLLARMYGFKESYQVIYSLPGTENRTLVRLEPARIDDVRKEVFKDQILKMDILNEYKAAIITISSFSYYDRVEFFKGFLDSCFTQIHDKHINNLILDLRGNDGGDPFCAVPLFSYLEKKPVAYFAEPYGRYAQFANPIPLANRKFEGKLYTLIDGRCFSTNGHFCALLKYHKIGKLVGSETGASYACNAATKTVRLDNSQIEIFISRKSFAAAVKNMDLSRPIMPDYHVKQTYRDFLEGKDTVMNYTLNLIAKSDE